MNQETPTFESKSTVPQNETLKSDPLVDALEIQDLDVARNPEIQETNIDTTSTWASQQEQTIPPKTGDRFVKNVVKGAAFTGIAVAAATGIVGLSGGTDRGEEIGVEITGPTTIELEEGANLRFDPNVESGEWNNSALKLDEPITIDIDKDMRKVTDTPNGTWVSIPVATLEEALPNADLSRVNQDKDGNLWVNEQTIKSITTDESQPEK